MPIDKTSTLVGSEINQLVKEISTISARVSVHETAVKELVYSSSYQGFKSIKNFKKKLLKWLERLKEVLFQLPFVHCGNERLVFMNLYKGLLRALDTISNYYKKTIVKKYKYLTNRKITYLHFRERFNPDYYPSQKDHAYHKLHVMYRLHFQVLDEGIAYVKEFASNGSSMLLNEVTCTPNEYVMAKQSVEAYNMKFKTDLSVPIVAMVLCKIMHYISPNFNKKQLAKIIAENFETKRAKELSENQVYKAMFDKDDKLNEVIKEIGIWFVNEGKRK